MHAPDVTLALADEAATATLGTALASVVTPGMVIWIQGNLGAGKTALVRALLRARGVTGPVKSPTYTLVEAHPISGIYFYHFDFYRFNQPEEYLDAGLDEYFAGHGVCLVEWPDKALPYLAAADLRIALEIEGEGRRARLHAATSRGLPCLTAAAALPGANSCAPVSPG